MIVKCIKNKREELPAELLANYDSYVKGQERYIKINIYYFIFGITFRKGMPWYLILEEESDDYPISLNSGFFELVDSKIPNDWHFYTEASNLSSPCLTTKQWAETPFYEDLLDAKEYAVKSFQKQREIAVAEVKKFL